MTKSMKPLQRPQRPSKKTTLRLEGIELMLMRLHEFKHVCNNIVQLLKMCEY